MSIGVLIAVVAALLVYAAFGQWQGFVAQAGLSALPGPINRVVNLRLVMPVQAAQGLAAELFSFLKSRGLDPVPVPEKDKLQ